MNNTITIIMFIILYSLPLTVSVSPIIGPQSVSERVVMPLEETIDTKLSKLCSIESYGLLEPLRALLWDIGMSCSEMDTLAYIAEGESTGGKYLTNSESTASGPFQYLDTTWSEQCQGVKDNWRDQVHCALKDIRLGRVHQWLAYQR